MWAAAYFFLFCSRAYAVTSAEAWLPGIALSPSATLARSSFDGLHSAGVTVAFGTGSVSDVRNLPYHAAKSAAFGLPKDEALKAVTINAAQILGLESEMGSIDVGKRADLIVTNGDPLQIVTSVERAFINGVEVSLESRHTRLWQQFRERH